MFPSRIRFGTRPWLREERARIAAEPYEHIRVRPVGATIGGEVVGIQLGELDDAAAQEIHRALLDYKVLFFRDQQLDTAQHIAFAGRFGELEQHPFLPGVDGHPELVRFEKGEDVKGVENVWHSDVSWREAPSLGSVLRAHSVPELGGDTLFADMVAAYAELPDETKQRLEGLVAVHDFSHSFGLYMKPEDLAKRQAEFPPAEHPVVRTHPQTGQKILYVNAIFTSHIVGMGRAESDALLEELYYQANVPEYQCRFHWQKNSVAFWDNRAVQHYATSDYWPAVRVMDRATIVGERPA